MKHKKIPLVKGHFLTGNAKEMSSENVLSFIHASRKKYGEIFRTRIFFMKETWVMDPHILEHIYGSNCRNYLRRNKFNKTLEIISGTGLFSNNDDSFSKKRKLMHTALSRRTIYKQETPMVTTIQSMVNQWVLSSQKDQTRNVIDDMQELALSIITKCAFNYNVNQDIQSIKTSTTDLVKFGWKRLSQPVPLPIWIPTYINRNLMYAAKTIEKVIKNIVKEKMENPGDDLVSSLILAEDADTGEKLSYDDIVGEAQTIILAGHETSARAMAFMFYYVAKDKNIQNKVHAEIEATIGKKMVQIDDLKNLEYTGKVVKEVLRICPPLWFQGRLPKNTDTIDGYVFKGEQDIVIPTYEIHHNEKYWPDPESFIPERFDKAEEKKRPKFAYIPFGAGPRTCVGMQFGLIEMSLTLVMVIQRFFIEQPKNLNVKLLPQLTLGSKEPINLKIKLRD